MRHLQVFVLFCALILSGCHSSNFNSYAYRSNVSQGNLVTQEMAKALYVGMSREQVEFLLGEALVKSQFHLNRWDYVYYFNPRYGNIERRTLSVYFDSTGRVSRLEHGELPTEREADLKVLDSRSKK